MEEAKERLDQASEKSQNKDAQMQRVKGSRLMKM